MMLNLGCLTQNSHSHPYPHPHPHPHPCSRLSEFDRKLKTDRQILLPKLRGGEVEAIEFDQLFQRIDSSIFNRQKFDSRLESNSEESALLTSFESISIVSTPLSAIISAIQYDFVCRLCLHYTELNDAQLMQMSDYLHNHQSETNTFTNTTDLTNFRSWLESHNVINRIRTEFVQFIEFTRATKKN
ncbi:unnamed protein product [Rotaria socialis]|uniref:SNTX thioredoxin-like domain-containing protein n=1 Tax=Rotaria socialis TaxID=392032 RepID=A0A818EPU5_9BILA|nr:unnamed protein product [Rotaria socialis]CAF3342782.1 unnamed protein product [Rotaria socialis]CAF3462434.1 unnamed protein product [Rotaria socialis]